MKMSGEVTKEELGSLVRTAVADAMKVPASELACPDCHAKFESVPSYLDHRVSEFMDTSITGLKEKVDAFKVPTAEEFLQECKDGFCKIMEETYDVTKKGEEIPPPEREQGLFDHYDDVVEEKKEE